MAQGFINFKFSIDRGGTFTDIYAEWFDINEKQNTVLKLLSEDPNNYPDAPREGIRRILYKILKNEKFADSFKSFPSFGDDFRISEIRMGTTIATNALLERKGEACALLITKGFKDLLEIGYQNRPKIFDLAIKKPELIYKTVIEVDERIIPVNQIIKKPDLDKLKIELEKIYQQGIRSLAVVLMHSYIMPDHERVIAELAQGLGFTNISLSSEIMPMIKIVPRGDTTLIDAYLTPLVKKYIENFKLGFTDKLKQTSLVFMKSDAGLIEADNFRGYNSILSGPAGGVVGFSSLFDGTKPLIGFDMGGTSTDVSRFSGDYEISFFTELNGLRIQAPQLEINTVAAGGGSRLNFEHGIFKVGPESSGANPGPVCYMKNGYLSITDANLVLGRLVPEYFPKVFGVNADQALNKDLATKEFGKLQTEVNNYLKSKNLKPMTVEEIAQGFIDLANETMARPIREISSMKGYPVKDHTLVCFGGAGGQHACSLARDLDIAKIIIPRYSGILSAFGIALADQVIEKQVSCNFNLKNLTKEKIENEFSKLAINTTENIIEQKFLHLRYEGTNNAFMILQPVDYNYRKAFEEKYKREYGFIHEDKEILVDDLRIRNIIKSNNKTKDKAVSKASTEAHAFAKTYFGSWIDTPIYLANDIVCDFQINGPAIIMQDTATLVIEPGFVATINQYGDIEIIQYQTANQISKIKNQQMILNLIMLSIFSNRFMSIAEQMGRTLERTSISTNIKERRDFSCAIFDKEANLIANAPHQPVHLGSMGAAVKSILDYSNNGKDLNPGDAILSNHPTMGGSHLPDMTVISPVFEKGQIIFFVANRAHHADIGGISPGSMPSFSTSLDQEGVAVKFFKIIDQSIFQEERLRRIFSQSRNIEDNIADLRAQIAANQKGIKLMEELIDSFSQKQVLSYMNFIQLNAEEAIRSLVKDFANKRIKQNLPLNLFAEDYMDEGYKIQLHIKLNPNDGSAIFDFTGTNPEIDSNLNSPKAVSYSAILYALRCMLEKDIPLNQGCLKPIEIILPENSLLNPSENAAVVGGNVLTSQRVVDVIFKAFNFCAASQGCMNNVIFGNDNFGYYETIGGGAGAGPGWQGASGVHTHMTNTRITDPEILETRYPVILKEFSIRENSGGEGKFRGGDGLIREFEFREDLTLSILTERRNYAPYGLAGGMPGTKGENWLNDTKIAAKVEAKLKAGDKLRILTPGGGAYGN